MDDRTKANLTRGSTWQRGLYMLLFALFYSVAEIVMTAVVVVQFGFLLISGHTNERLLNFGAALSRYIYEVYLFLSFNTETRPYPFGDWPADEAAGDDEHASMVGGQAETPPAAPTEEDEPAPEAAAKPRKSTRTRKATKPEAESEEADGD